MKSTSSNSPKKSTKDKLQHQQVVEAHSGSTCNDETVIQRATNRLVSSIPGAFPMGGRPDYDNDDASSSYMSDESIIPVVDDAQVVATDDGDDDDDLEGRNERLRRQVDVMRHRLAADAQVAEPFEDSANTDKEDKGPVQQRRKRIRRCIAGFTALGLIVLAIVGFVVASGPSKPLSNPIFGDKGTEAPVPTTPPANNRCTGAPPDLTAVVDSYLADPSPTTIVAVTYGWPIGVWCVAGHTDFSRLFSAERNGAAANFSEDLSGWDVADARDMTAMFLLSKAFQGNLSSWNVSRVAAMQGMFHGSTFNGDISGWDVSRVTNMRRMFASTPVFNGDLSRWQTSSLMRMDFMFSYSASFNADISEWDVSKVIDFRGVFQNATGFSQNLCEWKFEAEPSNTTNMFLGSGCPEHGDPDSLKTPPGPLCMQC